MSVSFTCLIFASFLYFLFVYVKFVKRKQKSVNNEPQRNQINSEKETTDDNFNETQSNKCTRKTDEPGINRFEMSAINGVGSVTNIGSMFEWEINYFSSNHQEMGDFLSSPVFVTTLSKNYGIEWRLRLYPRGDEVTSKDYLSLYIECLATDKIVGSAKFWILNDKKCKKWEWQMAECVFSNQKNTSWGIAQLVQRHLIMDPNNRVLLNDTLKICCEVILNPKQNSQLYVKYLDANLCDYRLEHLNDFENLLETGNSSDITLRVDGIEIKAHKAFLISRSPVFQAMFECDMKEKEENVVEILDIKYHIVKELLRFMYSSKVNNIQNYARELLVAAEKYCIKGLKVLCEHELSKRIKLKNVFQLLELATTYNADFLKSQTIQFIAKNKHSIVDRPEFKNFVDLNADTICEVFRSVVKSS